MDLGGASTQIAFAVQDNARGSNYMQVKLYGYPYNVYTHSFLCYGKNEAEKRILDKIVQVQSVWVQGEEHGLRGKMEIKQIQNKFLLRSISTIS